MSTPLVAPRKTPFEIYRPEDKISFLKIGLYGDPGVGKTTLAATVPNALIINAEAGDVALRDKGVDVVRINAYGELSEVYNFLKSGSHSYQSVVIDSLTEMHRKSMDAVLAREKHDMPFQADWGHSMEYIRRDVRRFRDLNMHVVFVLGAVFRQDDMTGSAVFMPNLPGKMAPEVMGYFDILGFMRLERNPQNKGAYERRLRVQPAPQYMAKDRTATLGAYLEGDKLNLSQVIEMINGERKEATVTDNE